MHRTMVACLITMALGAAAAEARAEGERWVLAEDGTWSQQAPLPPADRASPVGPWSPPQPPTGTGDAERDEDRRDEDDRRDDRYREDDRRDDRHRDDATRHDEDDDDRPMRSGLGFGTGIVLTAIGGSLVTGAALASLPVGYEGNGGEPSAELAAVAAVGALAVAGGIGLIVWSRAPASGPRTTLAVGPGDVRLSGSF